MGNLSDLTGKYFTPDTIKEGYKNVGLVGSDHAKIIKQKGNIYLTAPWKGEYNEYYTGDGEWMVFEKDALLAEFLRRKDAITFFNCLVNNNVNKNRKSKNR